MTARRYRWNLVVVTDKPDAPTRFLPSMTFAMTTDNPPPERSGSHMFEMRWRFYERHGSAMLRVTDRSEVLVVGDYMGGEEWLVEVIAVLEVWSEKGRA